MHTRISRRRGFTLLELMVVITIIGLLSAVVVLNTKSLPPKARRERALRDMRNILTVAEAAYVQNGRWPESTQEMATNTELTVRLETMPKDPWTHSEYLYDLSSGTPIVTCLGSDNRPGGDGEAADFTLPEPQEGQ